MSKKALVYCSHGLGDGILFFLIAENLAQSGYQVVAYHPSLFTLDHWFPSFSIKPYPSIFEIEKIVEKADIIVINKDHLIENQKLVKKASHSLPKKTFILSPTSRKRKLLAINDREFGFDRNRSVNENLLKFCKQKLFIKNPINHNGILPKKGLKFQKYKNRIIIHPTSKSKNRNWSEKKFVKLALHLKKLGYDPHFVMTSKERKSWDNTLSKNIAFPITNSLEELSCLLYESKYFIGSDSGVGHLASCLGINTLSLIISKRKAPLWRPSFSEGQVVLPLTPLPHFKGFRLRDKWGKYFIASWQVRSAFNQLVKQKSVL